MGLIVWSKSVERLTTNQRGKNMLFYQTSYTFTYIHIINILWVCFTYWLCSVYNQYNFKYTSMYFVVYFIISKYVWTNINIHVVY